MSFALDVKKEVATLNVSNEGLKAELYGIVKLKANILMYENDCQFEFVSASLFFVRRITFLLKRIYKINLEIFSSKRPNLDYKDQYYIIVSEKAKEILIDLDIIDADLNFVKTSSAYDNNKDNVLRGFFLARGSINDPRKSNYHLEIVCNDEHEVDYLLGILSDYYIEGKVVERSKGLVVYIKKSEHIGDFLKIIGANNMLFSFENERIKRDLNNVVNRIMNCDIANSSRTQASALRQLQDIKIIEEHKGFGSLSTRLMEAIILRTNYPDSSLSELSEVSEQTIGRHLSKSGINHCFRDLRDLAKTLKNE